MKNCYSIVVPTYKRIEQLERCLISLVKQEYEISLFEIIVVSDGYFQPASDLIRLYQLRHPAHRISLYNLPFHKGPAAARNMGWCMAMYDQIIFLDDDCIALPDWLAGYQHELEHHPEAQVIHGRIIIPASPYPTDYEQSMKNMETASFITANCLVSKYILKQTGGFDEDFTLAWREDSAFECLLKELDIPIISGKPTVLHPINKLSGWQLLTLEKKNQFNYLFHIKYPAFSKKMGVMAIPRLYFLQVITCMISLLAVGFSTTIFLFFFLLFLFLGSILAKQRVGERTISFSGYATIFLTSLLLPFYSLFWNFYGILKFLPHVSKTTKKTPDSDFKSIAVR